MKLANANMGRVTRRNAEAATVEDFVLSSTADEYPGLADGDETLVVVPHEPLARFILIGCCMPLQRHGNTFCRANACSSRTRQPLLASSFKLSIWSMQECRIPLKPRCKEERDTAVVPRKHSEDRREGVFGRLDASGAHRSTSQLRHTTQVLSHRVIMSSSRFAPASQG